jgi:Vitamin K-dependent gamma-carboxylase
VLRIPEEVPAAPLRAFRVIIGLVAAAKSLEYAVSPYRGTLPRPLWSFLPTVPVPVWTALSAVLFVAGVLLALGRTARPAALVGGLTVFAFLLLAGYYANHAYLLATLLVMLSFTGCAAREETVWGPPVYLIRAQISIVYLFAALAKINLDFLTGNELASLGFHSMLAPRWVMATPFLPAMAAATVVGELLVAIGLWIPRLRRYAIAVGVLLHLGMIAYISPGILGVIELGLFAAMMIGGYLLFLPRSPFVRTGETVTARSH